MTISHNISSMFANRYVNINSDNVQTSMEKLSSGERINSAKSDAAGLAISEKMRAQIRGLNQASRNASDGISFIQTTEAYLTETTSILQRIRELAVQSSNGIYSADDRAMIAVEVSQLVAEVDRIASQAQFNGLTLLTGRFAKDGTATMQFHIGANMDENMQVYVGTMTAQALGLSGIQGDGKLSINSPEEANSALGTIDEALKTVTKSRADLGAYQNRMETAVKGIDIAAENLQAAESRIRDSDMAAEMTELAKNQILQQASVAMLSQANTNSQAVLRLLG